MSKTPMKINYMPQKTSREPNSDLKKNLFYYSSKIIGKKLYAAF